MFKELLGELENRAVYSDSIDRDLTSFEKRKRISDNDVNRLGVHEVC